MWDELLLIQDVNGPYDMLEKTTSHACSFLNRLLGRRSSDYLTEASVCDYTYYPPIQGESSEDAASTYEAWQAFIEHCR